MPLVEPMPLAPSPAQIRTVRKAFNLTQARAGGLLYRTARNWQQWELGEREMDPALWELFSIKAGALVSANQNQ